MLNSVLEFRKVVWQQIIYLRRAEVIGLIPAHSAIYLECNTEHLNTEFIETYWQQNAE